MTIYVTPEDKALGLAEFLFASLARVGSVTKDELSSEQIKALRSDRIGFDAINVKVTQRARTGTAIGSTILLCSRMSF